LQPPLFLLKKKKKKKKLLREADFTEEDSTYSKTFLHTNENDPTLLHVLGQIVRPKADYSSKSNLSANLEQTKPIDSHKITPDIAATSNPKSQLI
jgi:hypothetical protein